MGRVLGLGSFLLLPLALFACDQASDGARSADAGGAVPLVDSGASEAGPAGPGAPVEAGACPAGWLCPATPLYTSRVGIWYTNIYRKPAATTTPNYAEAFHWDVSRYEPSLGFYESDDSVALSAHLDEMNAAAIDFMLLDGTNGYTYTLAYDTDVLVHTQLARPPAKRVPIAFSLGAQLWASPPGSANAVPQHQAEVDKVFTDYAGNTTPTYTYAPAFNTPPGTEDLASLYFAWQGRPLMVVYNSYGAGANGLDWVDPRFTVRRAGAIVSPSAPATTTYGANGWWGWVTEYPQLVTKDEIGVTPGADNAHRGCAGCDYVLDREGGDLFEREWLRAIASNPRSIVIAGWNDFIDETAIEPASPVSGRGAPPYSDSYGAEVPDWYLQIVTAYSNLRTGLMPGRVYREEGGAAMYRVTDGALVAEAAMPHGQPVIQLPNGSLAALMK